MGEAEQSPPSTEDSASAKAFVCPGCQSLVNVVLVEEPESVDCPACGQAFMVPGKAMLTSPGEDELNRKLHEEELSNLRIRHVAKERRAVVRARAYCVMAAAICVTAAAELLWQVILPTIKTGWHRHFIGLIGLVGAVLWAAKFFYEKIVVYSAELKKKLLEDPTTPPDFSTLSDGSQHARDLENLR